MNKPFSQACENNKQAILNILKKHFIQTKQVLEIGSGSGQHGVYFAKNLPHLNWQTSDLKLNHQGINQWIDDFPSNNIKRPITIDLNFPWFNPVFTVPIDGIFTANTLHIVSWPLVRRFFEGVGANLSSNGVLSIYGPFNYHKQFTSQSNANFDLWLKDIDLQSGIRDFEAIVELADAAGLILLKDNEMPANNRLLVFVKD